MYEDIRQYVKTCDSCQHRGKKRTKEPLHPLSIERPFQRIGIDVVGPLPITERQNRYIVVATDYLTKWPEAKVLSEASDIFVAHFIYEEIICRHGCPEIILSDWGTHFRNQLIDNLLEKFEIQHYLSTPYHPQTNGLVERFNRTLCESLAKTVQDVQDWDQHIPSVLFAYRTARQTTTKITPFYLTYGREAKLPIYFQETPEKDFTILDCIVQLIDNLPFIREQTRKQIQKVQQKQKEYHDQQIDHVTNFNIGDKVLMYNAAKEKQWSVKLNEKWKGPFFIHDILPNGVYKLRTIDGKVLAIPININLLKLYHDRQNWKLMIVIDQQI
jgi:hypothetical protein